MKPGDLVVSRLRSIHGVQGSVGIIAEMFHIETEREHFVLSVTDANPLIQVLWPDQSVGLHYACNLEVISEAG
jgi:hypothetical protein